MACESVGLVVPYSPMLVMTRKVGERIMIGDNVVVTVVKIGNGLVRIGIEAPSNHAVVRRELLDEQMRRPSNDSSNFESGSQ